MKIMMRYNFIKKIVTGAPNDNQNQNNAHPKTVLKTDGVLLTNVQCLMVTISKMYYVLDEARR